MKVKANAKINLTLDIVGKRDDGYHLIDSVFQSVSLCDELVIEKNSNIEVCCTDSTINDKDNIVYKAAERFFEYTNINGGVKICIEKHIPLSAGLGGGSTDAAAAILALDKLYNTKLSCESLCQIGVLVGADVPFCIIGGTARVGGIGEKIEKLPNIPQFNLLLIKHGKKHSTADMYKKIDSCVSFTDYTETVVKGIENNDVSFICNNVSNTFLQVCNNSEFINDVKTTSPLAVSLSGSGPTVFAIYNGADEATNASKLLCDMGYNPINTTTTDKGIIFE